MMLSLKHMERVVRIESQPRSALVGNILENLEGLSKLILSMETISNVIEILVSEDQCVSWP